MRTASTSSWTPGKLRKSSGVVVSTIAPITDPARLASPPTITTAKCRMSSSRLNASGVTCPTSAVYMAPPTPTTKPLQANASTK